MTKIEEHVVHSSLREVGKFVFLISWVLFLNLKSHNLITAPCGHKGEQRETRVIKNQNLDEQKNVRYILCQRISNS